MPMITVSEEALNHIEQMARRIVAIKEGDEAAFQEILARARFVEETITAVAGFMPSSLMGNVARIIQLAESRLADTSRLG